MSIVSSYPIWVYFLCVIVGFGLSWLLYQKSSKLPEHRSWLKFLLWALRGLALSLLCFLLLNPFIKTTKKQVEKPIVLLAVDNSESILLNKDSAFIRQNLPLLASSIGQKLANDADFRVVSFGKDIHDSLSFDFKDKTTNIQSVFTTAENTYVNQNLAAVIIASDGIYNQGANPVYETKRLKNVPIYAIALGDTLFQRDLLVKKVLSNAISYLNNDFPLEIEVVANGLAGKNSVLELLELSNGNEKLLNTKSFSIVGNKYNSKSFFTIAADKEGLHHYRVRLKSLEGEITYSNNVKDIFVEVLTNKNKILLLARNPHPDISAIKYALEKGQNTDLEVRLVKNFDANLKDINAVILHQIPGIDQSQQALIQKIKAANLPVLYMIGRESDLTVFNNIQSTIVITGKTNLVNQTQADINKDFSLFTFSDFTQKRMIGFPPLEVPFGDYKLSNASIAINQKIGDVVSSMPVLAFGTGFKNKDAYWFGEGLWKWRFTEFEEHEATEAFTEILVKTLQYLTVSQDKRPFRVKSDKNIYNENEEIIFTAELFNKTGELINVPEVRLQLENQEKERFNFVLGKSGKRYYLNAGQLPPGMYGFDAATSFDGQAYRHTGLLSVNKIDIEGTNTTADHNLLNNICEQTGGYMFYLNNAQALVDSITSNADFKPVSYMQSSVEEMINIKWLLFLVALLLSVEWFIRKYIGGY